MPVERTFTPADIAAFAELSGDWNPLHTDPVAARRTHFGECVVHGVFLLMWALDHFEATATNHRHWAALNARFLRPVTVNAPVQLTTVEDADGRGTLTLHSDGRTVMQCDVSWADEAAATSANPSGSLPPKELPETTSLDRLSGDPREVDLHWSAEHGGRLFPALSRHQPAAPLALLLAATRVIGMKIPGEHSVFLQLDLAFEHGKSKEKCLTYRLSEHRKSTQRVAVEIDGAAGRGRLWALARPAPVMQPDMAAVMQHVPSGRFAGRNILIVGGSRGLGELAAKILAAGGARVTLTYRLGSNDAARIVADIQQHGGQAAAFQFEVGAPGWEETLARHGSGHDHLCYFATPPIVDGDGQSLSEPLFDRYAGVYVTHFIQVAQWMARQTSGKFSLFNASSVAVAAPPLRNLEYAAAKAASEACCRWLEAAHPSARIHVARFPRLLTDQTASFLSAGESDNLETVLSELTAWLPI